MREVISLNGTYPTRYLVNNAASTQRSCHQHLIGPVDNADANVRSSRSWPSWLPDCQLVLGGEGSIYAHAPPKLIQAQLYCLEHGIQPDGYLTEERKSADPDQGFSTFFSETGRVPSVAMAR